MNDKWKVGSVVKGKVIGIQPYGVFVQLSDHVQGLVHISEITNGYVKNIHDYVKIGQVIRVKIIGASGEGKLRLSMKSLEKKQKPPKRKRPDAKMADAKYRRANLPSGRGFYPLKKKLKEWIAQSMEEYSIKR